MTLINEWIRWHLKTTAFKNVLSLPEILTSLGLFIFLNLPRDSNLQPPDCNLFHLLGPLCLWAVTRPALVSAPSTCVLTTHPRVLKTDFFDDHISILVHIHMYRYLFTCMFFMGNFFQNFAEKFFLFLSYTASDLYLLCNCMVKRPIFYSLYSFIYPLEIYWALTSYSLFKSVNIRLLIPK